MLLNYLHLVLCTVIIPASAFPDQKRWRPSTPSTWGHKPTSNSPPSYHSTSTCVKSTVTNTVPHTKVITSTCFETKTVTRTKTQTVTPKPTTVKSTVTISSCSSTSSSSTTSSSPSVPLPTEACLLVLPGCAASGWKLDYYANPFAGYGYPPSGLGPGYYISEGLSPLGEATTEITYFPQDMDPDNTPVVYPGTTYDDGQAPYYVGYTRNISGIIIDANNFTLVYSGLYRAPSSGSFSLCTDADNINDVFFGAASGAFPCGGSPSADATPSVSGGVATGGNFDNPTTCFTETLLEGFYYPIRFVMANFQGPSALGFTITPPGGVATYDFTGLVYPPSCAIA